MPGSGFQWVVSRRIEANVNFDYASDVENISDDENEDMERNHQMYEDIDDMVYVYHILDIRTDIPHIDFDFLEDTVSVADYRLLYESLRRRNNLMAIADNIVQEMGRRVEATPRPISGIGLELRQLDDHWGYSALISRWQILKIRTSEYLHQDDSTESVVERIRTADWRAERLAVHYIAENCANMRMLPRAVYQDIVEPRYSEAVNRWHWQFFDLETWRDSIRGVPGP